MARTLRLASLTTLFLIGTGVHAQSMYRYQAENGDWVYADRPPNDEQPVEVRDLPVGAKSPAVSVSTSLVGRQVRLVARNDYHAPLEVVLAIDELTNLEFPHPEQSMRWVVEPRSSLVLLQLAALDDNRAPAVAYRFIWLPGDPEASHEPDQPYRAPFAAANGHLISQAFPLAVTHTSPDSYYAVDIAMPVGTDIYAARGGIVFEVAGTNFAGGMSRERDAASANLVRILHDDGSHAVYAHLNWNSIRVEPGDRVVRGQYIADSGNTGFTSGPHLHFAVMLNRGMRLHSVPVLFEGPNSSEIAPVTGSTLFAY